MWTNKKAQNVPFPIPFYDILCGPVSVTVSVCQQIFSFFVCDLSCLSVVVSVFGENLLLASCLSVSCHRFVITCVNLLKKLADFAFYVSLNS